MLVNQVDPKGLRTVRLVSDIPISEARMRQLIPTQALEFAQIKCHQTSALSVFHGEAIWPCRGDVVDFHLPAWPKFRRLVVWSILPGERMSEIVNWAQMDFFRLFMRFPQFAFANQLPKGIENGVDVNGCILLEAEWMLERSVCVGGALCPI